MPVINLEVSHMSESAMRVIAYILIIVGFLAILEALKAVSRALEKAQSPLLNRLPTVFVGLMLTVGGFLFWYSAAGNPINELALIRRGVIAKGMISISSKILVPDPSRESHVKCSINRILPSAIHLISQVECPLSSRPELST